MQRIITLVIMTFGILRPFPFIHTGISAVIYFAERLHGYKKRVAAKFKLVQGIVYQLTVHRFWPLLPFAL